jgi:hypothetical protein
MWNGSICSARFRSSAAASSRARSACRGARTAAVMKPRTDNDHEAAHVRPWTQQARGQAGGGRLEDAVVVEGDHGVRRARGRGQRAPVPARVRVRARAPEHGVRGAWLSQRAHGACGNGGRGPGVVQDGAWKAARRFTQRGAL